MTPDEVTAVADHIRAVLFGTPADQRLRRFSELLKPYPPAWQAALHSLVQLGREIEVNVSDREAIVSDREWGRKLTVAKIGGVALVLAVGLTFVFASPTALQADAIRTLIALGSAALAAVIPGLVKVELRGKGWGLIEAAGAMAVLVIVYFWNPSQPSAPSPGAADTGTEVVQPATSP